jgi:hypothetical protein
MRPPSPSDSERKVIRWFFGIAFCVAVVFIAWGWLSKRQDCVASCQAKGIQSASLELNAGGRLNLGTHCVCGK